MREIKFRAKDFTHKWNYGFVAKGNESAVIFPVADDGTVFLGVQIEVLPDTIGQFTGLHDKNGKDIYEGDIVKHNFSNNVFGVVKWHPLGYFYINVHWDKCETEFGYLPLGEVMHRTVNGKKIEIEVIGNVYDNKDLLNENKHGKKY